MTRTPIQDGLRNNQFFDAADRALLKPIDDAGPTAPPDLAEAYRALVLQDRLFQDAILERFDYAGYDEFRLSRLSAAIKWLQREVKSVVDGTRSDAFIPARIDDPEKRRFAKSRSYKSIREQYITFKEDVIVAPEYLVRVQAFSSIVDARRAVSRKCAEGGVTLGPDTIRKYRKTLSQEKRIEAETRLLYSVAGGQLDADQLGLPLGMAVAEFKKRLLSHVKNLASGALPSKPGK